MKVGNLEIVPILDGTGWLPPEQVVSHPEGKIWDCPHHTSDAEGRLQFDIGSFLIRISDRTILVDAGGGLSDEYLPTGALLDNLRKEGVDPGDVTDVFLTHMHFDHIGWTTTNGSITFENATVHVHEDDWKFFMAGPTVEQQVRDIIQPIEARVETFDEETEIIPGIIARPAPGHTPGSTIYVVHSAGERALLLGDVVHAIGELTEPEWVSVYDLDPKAAGAIRNQIAEEVIESGDVFASAHFPELGFGRLINADGMREFLWASSSARR